MADTPTIPWKGWNLNRIIGRGSYGIVYEIQKGYGDSAEKAALKVISIPLEGEESDLQTLFDAASIADRIQETLNSVQKEYDLMSELNDCPNIVLCDAYKAVPHKNTIGWDVYIKLELLEPLVQSLPSSISETTVLQLAMDMCTALEACQKHQIIHRDIKPQNIFVSANGQYKLGDFGIAKSFDKTMIHHTMIGTISYMAPEVYLNQESGANADIYSLGLVLYWLLNDKRLPFYPPKPEKISMAAEKRALDLRMSGKHPIPQPAHGSNELKRIVLKACSFNLNDRYTSATEMYHDLAQLCKKNASLRGCPVTISFLNDDGVCLAEDTYSMGDDILPPVSPTRPNTNGVTYQFLGWDPPFCSIATENITYHATYSEKRLDIEKQPVAFNKKAVLIVAAAALTLITGTLVLLYSLRLNASKPDTPSNVSLASNTVSYDALEDKNSNSNNANTSDTNSEERGETSDSSTTVNDTETENPHLLSISLDKKNMLLYTGSIEQLSVSSTPTDYALSKLTWSTSNQGVASVDNNGIVKGISPGTATITAESDGKKAACQITVKKDTVSNVVIKEGPDKTIYYSDESVDPTGIVLEVTFQSGAVKTVTSGFDTMLDSRTGELLIEYEDITSAPFPLTIKQKILITDSGDAGFTSKNNIHAIEYQGKLYYICCYDGRSTSPAYSIYRMDSPSSSPSCVLTCSMISDFFILKDRIFYSTIIDGSRLIASVDLDGNDYYPVTAESQDCAGCYYSNGWIYSYSFKNNRLVRFRTDGSSYEQIGKKNVLSMQYLVSNDIVYYATKTNSGKIALNRYDASDNTTNELRTIDGATSFRMELIYDNYLLYTIYNTDESNSGFRLCVRDLMQGITLYNGKSYSSIAIWNNCLVTSDLDGSAQLRFVNDPETIIKEFQLPTSLLESANSESSLLGVGSKLAVLSGNRSESYVEGTVYLYDSSIKKMGEFRTIIVK